jgi:hypothetical protein
VTGVRVHSKVLGRLFVRPQTLKYKCNVQPIPAADQLGHEAVCFFVLCNRHWFNRVPGATLGIVCLPFTLTPRLAVPNYP